METQCNQQSFGFQPLGKRDIVAWFDGGRVTSDGGAILLRQIEERLGLIERFAACFSDHDWLRHDAMLAVLVGKEDPAVRNGGQGDSMKFMLAGQRRN